jgi:mono/diheme cytochrome c family protein
MKPAILLLFLAACSGRAAADDPHIAELFAGVCGRCHGQDGRGGVAEPGRPTPRNFHDAAFQADRTDEQIRAVIANGKGGVMPPFAATFSAAEIDGLVARVRSFDPRRQP